MRKPRIGTSFKILLKLYPLAIVILNLITAPCANWKNTVHVINRSHNWFCDTLKHPGSDQNKQKRYSRRNPCGKEKWRLNLFQVDFCNNPEQLLIHAREGEELGRAHGLPLMSEVLAEISKGIVSLRMRHTDSITKMRQVTKRLADTGQLIWGPYLKALLAEAICRGGDPDQALKVISEAITDSDARQEFSHYAEILRLQAWILLKTGNNDEAERVLEMSIGFARQQQSRSWELRSTMTLVGLLKNRGQKKEARDRLEKIYKWFTEGHDTHDLVRARLLIDELNQ